MPVCIHTHICKYPYVYKKGTYLLYRKKPADFYMGVCRGMCIYMHMYMHIVHALIPLYNRYQQAFLCVCLCMPFDLFFSLYTDISSVMKQYSNSNRASCTKNILSPSIKNEPIIALNLLFRSALLLRLLPCLFFG